METLSYGQIMARTTEGTVPAGELVHLEGSWWVVVDENDDAFRAVRLDETRIYLLPEDLWNDRLTSYYADVLSTADASVFPGAIRWAEAGDPDCPPLPERRAKPGSDHEIFREISWDDGKA